MTIIEEMFAEVSRQELLKQQGKFLETPQDTMNRGAIETFLSILVEEVGEVSRAINDDESLVNLKKEIIQVMAVCYSGLIGLDCGMVRQSSAI